jgi:hypothetical protein
LHPGSTLDFYPVDAGGNKQQGKLAVGCGAATHNAGRQPSGIDWHVPEGRGDGRGAHEFVMIAGSVLRAEDNLPVKEF